MHTARRVQVGKRSETATLGFSTSPRTERGSHHGRQTLIHLQLTRALAGCSCRERQRRISASGSLYRVYHVCACEYRTYKWKKDGPGRPSPAANPLIYRLRVSACIRRLGHMPLPPRHHLFSSFYSRPGRPPSSCRPLSLSFSPFSSPSSAFLSVPLCPTEHLPFAPSKIPRESLLYEFRGRRDTLVRESRLMAAHILDAWPSFRMKILTCSTVRSFDRCWQSMQRSSSVK